MSCTLDHAAATAALKAVPRLQRKHYELIPKVMDEMAFWDAFFSHATVIVEHAAPHLLPSPGQGALQRAVRVNPRVGVRVNLQFEVSNPRLSRG